MDNNKTMPNLTDEQKFHMSQWIDALRSGKYKQGFHALKGEEDNTFCTLGVAYALCLPTFLTTYQLRNYYGLSSFRLLYQEEHTPLITLNDVFRLSFNEIADLLEQTYLSEDAIVSK